MIVHSIRILVNFKIYRTMIVLTSAAYNVSRRIE